MNNSTKPLRRVLEDGSPTFAALSAELRRQQRVLAHIREILPAPVARHCIGTRLVGSTLTVFADSAGWATRLRFHGPEIVALVRQAYGLHVERAQFRIIADVETAHQHENRRPSLSARAAMSLRAAADDIEDRQLKESLHRLATHGK